MIDNSSDKGYITVVTKKGADGKHLCEIGFTKGSDEESFYVDYENGEIFIDYSDGKEIIGTYETTPSDQYGAKVFDYPSNRLIGLVGNELIYFYKGNNADRIILDGACLADYSEAGSISLHGHPLDDFGLINGGEIGGAAAFVALFYSYKFNSIFRDYYDLDDGIFSKKYQSYLNPYGTAAETKSSVSQNPETSSSIPMIALSELNQKRESLKKLNGIITACGSTLGVKIDGTVLATKYLGNRQFYYDQYNVGAWRNIAAIATTSEHTVGLRKDGTVVAKGKNGTGRCDVNDWRDIIAVATGFSHTVGLRSDGTLISTGSDFYGQCDVNTWSNIIAIAAGDRHTVGLKADGSVVATRYTGSSGNYGQCDVSNWQSIVAISAGSRHTVGLRADGTVVATAFHGDDYFGQCDVGSWRDIVAIAANATHTVGLRSDGTVIATRFLGASQRYYGQCDVGNWRDIIAITAGFAHTVGLKSDGTVVATKYVGDAESYYGQCEVNGWRLFNNYNTLELERQEAEKKQKRYAYSELQSSQRNKPVLELSWRILEASSLEKGVIRSKNV